MSGWVYSFDVWLWYSVSKRPDSCCSGLGSYVTATTSRNYLKRGLHLFFIKATAPKPPEISYPPRRLREYVKLRQQGVAPITALERSTQTRKRSSVPPSASRIHNSASYSTTPVFPAEPLLPSAFSLARPLSTDRVLIPPTTKPIECVFLSRFFCWGFVFSKVSSDVQ